MQWVLSDLDSLIEEGVVFRRPGVAILPLGTGNDLSRQFGWGHGYRSSLLRELKTNVATASGVALDRWSIKVTSSTYIKAGGGGSGKAPDYGVAEDKNYVCSMSNYFGIGLDAKIVDNFEGCRKSYPSLFCCRFSNNMIYGCATLYNIHYHIILTLYHITSYHLITL